MSTGHQKPGDVLRHGDTLTDKWRHDDQDVWKEEEKKKLAIWATPSVIHCTDILNFDTYFEIITIS